VSVTEDGMVFLKNWGDSKYLHKIDLTKHPKYLAITKKYPRAELWFEGNLEKVVKTADGDQRFIWRHRILNGCHACENVQPLVMILTKTVNTKASDY
jgi:hypothetical protein